MVHCMEVEVYLGYGSKLEKLILGKQMELLKLRK